MALVIQNQDFTTAKYEALCRAISRNYESITFREYLSLPSLPERFVIMRHDVDRRPMNSLRTARIERDLGIRATYYFRYHKGAFSRDTMGEINGMGHEIGYHYETLSKARGDYRKAIESFGAELGEFRKVCDVRTACMHGSPMSRYNNLDIWKHCDIKDFGLVGESYLNMRKDMSYFSDTGRTWGINNKMRDRHEAMCQMACTTDDLIGLIESYPASRVCILTHPERWAEGNVEWGFYLANDMLFNFGKKVLSVVRH